MRIGGARVEHPGVAFPAEAIAGGGHDQRNAVGRQAALQSGGIRRADTQRNDRVEFSLDAWPQAGNLSSVVTMVVIFHPELNAQILAHRSEEHTSELQSLMRTSYAVFCLKK